jgi:cholesterol transport system auxiliary component
MSAGLIPCRAFLLAAALLGVPPGCSVLPAPPVAQIYRLSPQPEDPPGRAIPHSKLTIDLPVASQSLDTDRIALAQGRTRFDYYANSVWTDRLPVLLQTLLVEAFEADGRIAKVNRDIYGLAHGNLLRTEIRRFEAQYAGPATGPPEVVVVLGLRLSTGPEGRLVGHRLVSARVQASRDKLDAVVTAFDAAIGEALAQSVTWTVRAISTNRYLTPGRSVRRATP